MKVKCEIVLDLDTGQFNLNFKNLTNPGEPMDYARIRKVLKRVVDDVDEQQRKRG